MRLGGDTYAFRAAAWGGPERVRVQIEVADQDVMEPQLELIVDCAAQADGVSGQSH